MAYNRNQSSLEPETNQKEQGSLQPNQTGQSSLQPSQTEQRSLQPAPGSKPPKWVLPAAACAVLVIAVVVGVFGRKSSAPPSDAPSAPNLIAENTDENEINTSENMPESTSESTSEGTSGSTSEETLAEVPAAPAADEVIEIPDPVLKRAIQSRLGIGDREILGEDAAKLKYLGISRMNGAIREQVHDLTGLSVFVNLERLFLPDHQITDISPLSGLTKLTELSLYGNQISDLSPLEGLEKLEVLSVEGNPVGGE